MSGHYKHQAGAVWSAVGKAERAKLLGAMGFKKEWAKFNSLDEVVAHGGGMVRREMARLLEEREKRGGKPYGF